ncbi:hypothetical protein MRX96_030638 [Rhipicephalus microplus]
MASKVILKNTTKLSLNERFTAYRQQAEAEALRAAAAAAAVPQIPPVPQASMRNVRLAQQMANRPSVLAALRLRKAPPVLSGGYMVPPPSIGAMERSMNPPWGWLGPAAQPAPTPWPAVWLGLRPLQVNGTRAGQSRRNRGAARAYYRQPRANGALRGQFGRSRNRRRRAQQQQQQQQGATGVNSGGQNDRRQLDQQLEAYMARTRSHLDAELDAYMAQASGSNS